MSDDEDENWMEEPTTTHNANDEYEYDLYNLTSFCYHPIDINQTTIDNKCNEFEEKLYQISCKAAQDLVNQLFQCPVKPSDVGPVAQLPSEKTRLPREKIIPEPKQLTKWEKFAKQKGIHN